MEQQTESTTEANLPDEVLMNRIYVFRGQKVMLDSDLADLYRTETKVLNQAVKRNINRFPSDFMFELTQTEYDSLRSQMVTLKKRGTHKKYLPFVFTEQGVAMLSSILKSVHAIEVNIQIMRMFTKMRQFLNDYSNVHMELSEVKLAIERLSKKQYAHDKNIDHILECIDRLEDKLEQPPLPERDKIGYKVGTEKD